ncbi:MAG: anaerobic ribonucleoside-triphosphate reductase, partial [Fusobacteriaceae bacterium]
MLDDGTNLLHGRGNIGVVSLNLPMIYAKAKEKNLLFFEELNHYVDLIRGIHKKTYDLIGKQKAGSNPLMFCEGGFYGGNLQSSDTIGEIVKKDFTASFGVTALNELITLATKKTLAEGTEFAIKTVEAIQSRVDYWRQVDGCDYSLYGTPAESLCKTQVVQFRKKYGIIEGVSDKDFFTNSFHMHVSEDITPLEKQDLENELFHMHTGGHIQYVKIVNDQNY